MSSSSTSGWSPSIPPSHTSGASHFDAEFEGLRFALVKLDNFSLHVHKPKWTCNLDDNADAYKRWATAGSFHGAWNPNIGFGVWESGFESNLLLSASPPRGCVKSQTNTVGISGVGGRSCLPVISGLAGGQCCEPLTGYTTMVNCENAYEPGYDIQAHITENGSCGVGNFNDTGNVCTESSLNMMENYSCFCWACRRHKNADAGCPETHWWNIINYSTSAAENIHGVDPGEGIYNWGGVVSSTYANHEGKGAYNDTKWYEYVGYSYWGSVDGIGDDEHNDSYYGVGMTMRDITEDSSYLLTKYPTGPNDPDDTWDGSDGIGNIIFTREGNTNSAEDNLITDNMSYYAIILIPTVPNHTLTNNLANDYKFVLHHDARSLAYQKLLGNRWPSSWGATAHGSASSEYSIIDSHFTDNGHCTSNDGKNGWYIAESNTGMVHGRNFSASPSNEDNYNRMFGGIMDGEFITLGSDWWEDNGTNNNSPFYNPWGIEILSELQKHMIVESCFNRLDSVLVPNGRYAKSSCVLVTKTPACAPHWEYFHQNLKLGIAGDSNIDGIELIADNPYFNLHVTHNATGKTIVFKDVATGLQDSKYGQEQTPPEDPMGMYTAGLTIDWSSHQNVPIKGGLNGMTIAAELVEDWEQYVFSEGSFNWDDIKVQTLRTVGWDARIKETDGDGNTGGMGPLTSSTGVWTHGTDSNLSSSGDRRGAFYEFDARVYLKPSVSHGFIPRRITHIYGDATGVSGNTGALDKVLNRYPVGAYGGHTNSPTSNNYKSSGSDTGNRSNGWDDHLYGMMYIGLQEAQLTSSSIFKRMALINHPEPFCKPTNIFKYSPGNPDLANMRMIDHFDGSRIWPDYNNTEIRFKDYTGIRPYKTHSNTAAHNNWAICTGNGMVYNSNPLPYPGNMSISVTATDAQCSTGEGFVNVTVNNGGAGMTVIIDNIKIIGGNIAPSQLCPPTSGGGWTPTVTSISSPTIYNFACIPQGNGTVVVTDNAGQTYTAAFTISYNDTVSYSVEDVVISTTPTCANPGELTVEFDASNISNGSLINNGRVQWTLWRWETIAPLTFGWVTYSGSDWTGNPFGNANAYGPGTGVAPVCANINASGASCTGSKFLIPNVSDGQYRVSLHHNFSVTDATIPYTFPSGVTFLDDDCNSYQDITVSSGTISFLVTDKKGVTCNTADREIEPPCCLTANCEGETYQPAGPGTPSTGYIESNQNLTPTNIGFFTIEVLNAVLPVKWETDSPSGVTTNSGWVNITDWDSECGNSNSIPNWFSAAEPGTHIISIIDDNGCTASTNITIPEPTALAITTNPTAVAATCSGGLGSISGMVVEDDNSSYSYDNSCSSGATLQYAVSTANAEVWNSTLNKWELPSIAATWQNSSTFSIGPGTYYVWAKNQCGCSIVSGAVTVGGSNSLTSTIAVTNPGCSGGTASIAVSASGGSGSGYTYSWSTVTPNIDPLFPTTTPTGSSFTQVAPGGSYDYECIVGDSNGCTQTLTASTVAGDPLTLTYVVSGLSCAGGSNASINITATGGTAPYSYSWTGPGVSGSAEDQTGLGAGTYAVTVTDSTGTPCTTSQSWVIAATGGAEEWIDINQYAWSGYNTPYGDSITQSTANDNTYGKYGGPTCPGNSDGTIRLMLDDDAPVVGASFPFQVWLSNDGGANYYRATNNGGTNLEITTAELVTPSTGIQAGTGVVYDPQTAVDGVDYFEITGNSDKWNPGGGAVVLPFTENSTWHVKLIEVGASPCTFEFSTTILPSDYRNVYNQPVITHPTCCGCSSYGASNATNVCNGAIDNSPIRGTYENHVGDVAYTYLWTYATLPSTCTVPGHNNSNTQWANLTTQDISAEWPGIYTIVTTDSCSGTDTDILTVNDPVIYIDDITWVPPQCISCCTGTLTITAHGGDGALEVSLDNGDSFTAITSPHTFTNMCGGINSIWVKDSSSCAVEYSADPDDLIILSDYSDNCFANANTSSIISTSGSWIPTSNSNIVDGSVATVNAFTDSSSTKIELIPVSDFSKAQACVTSHNIIPGDTNGEITLSITGGTAPYEIAIVVQAGPFYTPATGMTPCWGIGPLTTTDPCTMTNDLISTHGPGLDGGTVMEYEQNYVTGAAKSAVSSSGPIITNLTELKFTNVSVSTDLGYGALGAEYIFYVRDANGCYQTSHVGLDNGIFGIISIYGAINCDCICPIGYTYNETTEECDSSVASPSVSNGTLGYWTRSVSLYTSGILPAAWQDGGCALYGVYNTGTSQVDYAQSITVDTTDLPFTKDIVTSAITGPNHLYKSVSTTSQIGTDLAVWSTANSSSALNTRINDIAIWLDQASPAPVPPAPVGEWIGCIMETNFGGDQSALIAMASDAKMRMKVDGVVWIDMVADESTVTTGLSNYKYLNLFPIVLPGGLHTISFEVYNTIGDAFMAFEVYANDPNTTPNFLGEAVLNSFSVTDIENYTLEDNANPPNKISSIAFDTKEIQLGETTYGYSCTEAGDAITYSNDVLFCYQDVNAPCEVPLDCGYCLSDTGVPQPQWTKKGPCEKATDGHPTAPTLLNNVWVTDYSELSDLVECPGALANIAYARLMGALATKTLDVRQIWMTIMIRHLLHNLNTCMTLSDIQDLFTGFLDDVCPTCDTGIDLTPAQMEALTSIFTLNTNSNFDF